MKDQKQCQMSAAIKHIDGNKNCAWAIASLTRKIKERKWQVKNFKLVAQCTETWEVQLSKIIPYFLKL